MIRRGLVRAGLLLTAALLLLNVSSCVLARTCANGELWTGPLPGSVRVPDTDTLADLPIWTPGIGLGERAIGVFYAYASRTTGERNWLPFAAWRSFGGPYAIVSIAYWPLLLLIGIPSILAVVLPRQRRRQRLAKGLCLACGYDLTRNTSGQCPECGKQVQPDPPSVLDKALAGLRRHRRKLKWYGTAVSLLIVAVLAISEWVFVRHVGWPFDTYLRDARIYVHLTEDGAPGDPLGWTIGRRLPFDCSNDRILLELGPFCALVVGLTLYFWLLDVLLPRKGGCPGCGYPLARIPAGIRPECGKTV